MDWFFIKKAVSAYLHPLSLFLEMTIIGVVLIAFSRKQSKKKPGPRMAFVKKAAGAIGMTIIILGAFSLYLCSIRPFADPMMYALEKRYPPIRFDDPANREIDPDFIVVLAAGERFNNARPNSSQLTGVPMARMLEVARLRKHFTRAQLVVTGTPRETSAMAKTAELLGLGDAIIEKQSRDTKDHALFLREILKDSKFVLVTSGIHMPRAMALFEAQGLRPIPCSCDHMVWPTFGDTNPYDDPRNFIPRSSELAKTERAFHEYLGIVWANMKGQLTPGLADKAISTATPELPDTIEL